MLASVKAEAECAMCNDDEGDDESDATVLVRPFLSPSLPPEVGLCASFYVLPLPRDLSLTEMTKRPFPSPCDTKAGAC